MISTTRALFGLLSGARRLLVLSSALSVAQAALLVPIGLLFEHTFDESIPDGRTGAIVLTGATLAVLALASVAIGLWTRYLVLGATKTAVLELRVALLARIQELPASWADRTETGRLHAAIVQDSERVDVMGTALAGQLVPAAIIAVALTAALLTINPLLVAVLIPVAPAVLGLTRWLGGMIRERTNAWQDARDRFSTRTLFALRARSLVAASGAEAAELGAAREELGSLRDASRAMSWMQHAYVEANAAAAMLVGALVLVVGGLAVVHDDMTLGALVAFYGLTALLRGQLLTVVAVVPEVIAGGESLARLRAILDADEPQPYQGTRVPVEVLPLVLSDVHFAYRPGSPVLQGTSIEIRPGERIAIVGPNGVGKSTVAALVLGLYRPGHGQLLAASVPFEVLDVRALRRRIAIVPADPILFPGTIAENIAYGVPDEDPDPARIAAAARRATAATFIDALPEGFDTPVGDEGGLLSSGQRQRIAIARALIREPTLLILDEPTTSLDSESVKALLTELSDVPADRAIVVISHDDVVAGWADRVHALEPVAGVVPGS